MTCYGTRCCNITDVDSSSDSRARERATWATDNDDDGLSDQN